MPESVSASCRHPSDLFRTYELRNHTVEDRGQPPVTPDPSRARRCACHFSAAVLAACSRICLPCYRPQPASIGRWRQVFLQCEPDDTRAHKACHRFYRGLRGTRWSPSSTCMLLCTVFARSDGCTPVPEYGPGTPTGNPPPCGNSQDYECSLVSYLGRQSGSLLPTADFLL